MATAQAVTGARGQFLCEDRGLDLYSLKASNETTSKSWKPEFTEIGKTKLGKLLGDDRFSLLATMAHKEGNPLTAAVAYSDKKSRHIRVGGKVYQEMSGKIQISEAA